MNEILGTDATVTYADDELVVRELGSAGRERLRARPTDLLRVWCAQAQVRRSPDEPPVPHHVALRLVFRSPDFLVDGRPSQRAPFDVELPLSALEATLALAKTVSEDVRETRRIRVERPALPAPPEDPDALRPDLMDAFTAMTNPSLTQYEVAAIHTYLEQDEVVLRCAATLGGGLLTVTTKRAFFNCIAEENSFGYEFPLDWIVDVRLEADAAGNPTTVLLDDGFSGLRFHGIDTGEAQALVDAVMPVIEADQRDGLLGADRPGAVELFAEWQLLVERRQLGMVDEEEMQRTGGGILGAMP